MSFPSGSDEDERRHALEGKARELGPEGMHRMLAELDPESAALVHPNNVRRVIRAIELAQDGGSYARQLDTLHEQAPRYDARIWAIDLPRERLYERIEARVDAMFDEGLVEEVRALQEVGLADSHTARQAIGYKEIMDALAGRYSLDEARETIKIRTRHYAKRQLSWFRRDGRVRWLSLDEGTDAAVQTIVDDVRG